MERLTVGSLDALVFVHPVLGEYLAGRYLAQLDDAEFARVLRDNRRKAKWREPILLAAGAGAGERAVGALWSLDSPDDPESTETLLAAAALGECEAGGVSQSTVENIAGHLKVRLSSPVPLIAIEAGPGLVNLAQLAPDLVCAVAGELWDNLQPWTRLALSSDS